MYDRSIFEKSVCEPDSAGFALTLESVANLNGFGSVGGMRFATGSGAALIAADLGWAEAAELDSAFGSIWGVKVSIFFPSTTVRQYYVQDSFF